jgi:hypothetical protein
MTSRIGLIGAGNMGTAMAAGFVAAGCVPDASYIAGSSPDAPFREAFEKAVPGAFITASNAEVAARSDVLILSVKPDILGTGGVREGGIYSLCTAQRERGARGTKGEGEEKNKRS